MKTITPEIPEDINAHKSKFHEDNNVDIYFSKDEKGLTSVKNRIELERKLKTDRIESISGYDYSNTDEFSDSTTFTGGPIDIDKVSFDTDKISEDIINNIVKNGVYCKAFGFDIE